MEFKRTKITAGVALLLVLIVTTSCSWGAAEDDYSPVARVGCQDKCGSVKIPFPFGIGHGCFLTNLSHTPPDTYKIVCDNTSSSNGPRPLSPVLGNREVLNISLQDQTIRVSSGAAYDCHFTGESVPSTSPNNSYYNYNNVNYDYMPIKLSSTRNKFIAIGCNTTASLQIEEQSSIVEIARCTTSCSEFLGERDDGVCDPVLGCCELPIDRNMTQPSIHVGNSSSFDDDEYDDFDHPCSYAFVGEVGSYKFSKTNLTATAVDCFHFRVSLLYDWFLPIIPGQLCSEAKADGYQIIIIKMICSSNSMFQCHNLLDPISDLVLDSFFSCHCLEEYSGNPYLPHGCQDIDECKDDRLNKCEKQEYCMNKKGGYECKCPNGYLGNATFLDPCIILPSTHVATKLIIGFSIVTGSTICSIVFYGLLNLIKRRKEISERDRNFKRNGGLLLQKKMTANEGVIDKTKIFTQTELVKATNNFNENRVLGRGGQGTVYKGMLEDGTIVAVKKSKKVDENQLNQFVNEVVILSQINHRNIVRLFGCCLETDVPLLVYEFVHNGTLYQRIHHPTEDFQMNWEARLQIAAECAGAVAYLHSSCSSPIYHRDIKSSNILLDEKYNAKISDFGTSRSISIDKTHVTTCVQGTFGYLDPEFFRSSQFSAKSDVYSFGVVLLELLTSKKSIFTSTTGEPRGLAIEFTQIMEASGDQLHGILDNEVLQHCSEEDILALTELIEQCLSMNLKQRPTMKEVAMTLETIKKTQHDKTRNLANNEEIKGQVWEDDSDNTNESSYSLNLHTL